MSWYRERNEEVAERFAAEVAQTLEHLEQFPLTEDSCRVFPILTFAGCPFTTLRVTSCSFDWLVAFPCWPLRTIGGDRAIGIRENGNRKQSDGRR
jgi:hypothetical protein